MLPQYLIKKWKSIKINQCNLPYQQTREERLSGHLISTEIGFEKMQHLLMIKKKLSANWEHKGCSYVSQPKISMKNLRLTS